jgi:hypothetical protein
VRAGGNAVLTPAGMSGVKFRVPRSKMLQQYCRMVGANPTTVAWGETPSAIKQGVADTLDPAVGALYVFAFKDIPRHVTFTEAVPDGQVHSMNLEWFNGLRVSMVWFLMAVPVGFGLMVLRLVRSFLRDLSRLRGGTPVYEGDRRFD